MVLMVTLVTALTIGGAFAGVSYAFNRLQRDQLDAALLILAREEAAHAAANHFSFTENPGPQANNVGPLSKHGVIYDEGGRALAATAPFDVEAPVLAWLAHRHGVGFDVRAPGGEHLRAVLVPLPGAEDKTLLLATSREDLDGDEHFLFRAMLVAFVVALAWAAAVASWSAGMLTRDHGAIASAARRVAGGDLDARVSIRARDRETAQLGDDINAMIQRLASAIGTQQRFLAHAAHELRSPLTKLYGELQQALRKERDTDGYRKAISEALEATRRLNVLAEQLLALVRTTRAPKGEDEPASIEAIVRSAVELTTGAANAHSVSVEVAGQDALVVGRPDDLVRMVRNLVENAIQHSPWAGRVAVGWRVEDDVVLTVRDEGSGVSAADRERIFEPFVRGGRGPGDAGGAGLGLSIAREIALAHGGSVSVAEADGPPGAVFRVTLPRAIAEEPRAT